jgi:hypothetical protein
MSITARADRDYFIYRIQEPSHCYVIKRRRSEQVLCNKRHQDPRRSRRSRFAGTWVSYTFMAGTCRGWMPYEIARPGLAQRMGELLKSRMYATCSRFEPDALPVSPASMARDYLGCSLSALVEKFEHQFEDGMTWDNFGARGWVIDHILPVSRFDFRKISHIRRACHYRNLRPCWEAENIRKGNRLVPC